ncbi:hypothetical protein [Planomonospora sp. ID82291]|uniref:hypothetical protein n=1 Tax=Planomonospora sp. ID82291 TaxID=2738136 RepID=UPI0018C4074B|nr:hypothetical protein [Planomonospora sp. ID82291]MBG0815053.1 hypothetical protein [Planomonospora sp. ID82291]
MLGGALVIVATAGAAAIGLIAGQGGAVPDTAAAGVGGESPAVLAWGRGACVDRRGARFDLVPCAAADGTVISVVGVRASECPAETDELVVISGAPAAPGRAGAAGEVAPQSLRTGRTACVRDLRGPRAGEPGRGGGVLRAGDCLALRGGELPCSARGWYGRVLAVVGAEETCPDGALDALAVGGREVACLGEGGGVLAVGDCVVRPRERLVSRLALTRAPCGSSRAWARVTARAGSTDGCPAGSDRYLRVRGPGIPRPVTCLRRVALHGSP